MKKWIACVLVLGLYFQAACMAFAEEKYSLKIRYPEGTYTMIQEMEMDMATKMKVGEMGSMRFPSVMKQTYEMRIIAGPVVEDGSQKVEMEFVRVAADVSTSGIRMRYDSGGDAKKNARSPLKVLDFMVGVKFSVTYDKDGKAAKVEGVDALWDKMLAKSNAATKEMMESLREKMLSEEALAKMINVGMESYSEKTVAVSESWDSETEMEVPMIGKIRVKATHTLESVEKRDGTEIATIRSRINMEAEDLDETILEEVKMQFEGYNILADSTLVLDVKTGLPISGGAKMTQRVVMKADNAGEMSMNMEIDGTSETRTTVTREEQ